MILTFDRARVQRLLDHTKAATEWNAQWSQPETAVPGLILVGDQGVYLMENSKQHLLQDGTVSTGKELPGSFHCFVCYADQVNPETMPFEQWYQNKREYYGGGDGSQFFPASEIENWISNTVGNKLRLDITPTHIKLLFSQRPLKLKLPKPPKEKQCSSRN